VLRISIFRTSLHPISGLLCGCHCSPEIEVLLDERESEPFTPIFQRLISAKTFTRFQEVIAAIAARDLD
jgi:hypothetical protein